MCWVCVFSKYFISTVIRDADGTPDFSSRSISIYTCAVERSLLSALSRAVSGVRSRPAGAPRGAAPPQTPGGEVRVPRQQDEAPEQIFFQIPHPHPHLSPARTLSEIAFTPFPFSRACALVHIRDVVRGCVFSNDHNAEKAYFTMHIKPLGVQGDVAHDTPTLMHARESGSGDRA